MGNVKKDQIFPGYRIHYSDGDIRGVHQGIRYTYVISVGRKWVHLKVDGKNVRCEKGRWEKLLAVSEAQKASFQALTRERLAIAEPSPRKGPQGQTGGQPQLQARPPQAKPAVLNGIPQ